MRWIGRTGRKKEKGAIIAGLKDNVAVVLEDVTKGEEVRCCGSRGVCIVQAQGPIFRGHKLAIRSIAPKENIVKCDIPIGFASKRIKKGESVHIHNLSSFVQEGSL